MAISPHASCDIVWFNTASCRGFGGDAAAAATADRFRKLSLLNFSR
jgi:hypothetical protein